MLKRFQDKVVLITGATEGVGYHTAKQFAEEGAKLVLVDSYQNMSRMGLSSEDSFISERSLLISADMGIESQIPVIIDDIIQNFGQIDILIHAARMECSVGQITNTEAEELDSVFVNIKDVFFLLKYVIPIMQQKGNGSIITYGTIAGVRGLPLLSSYVMLNHAIIGLTKTAAMETIHDNIRVNAICSAPIESQIMSKIENQISPGMEEQVRANFCYHIPMGRYGLPNEVANLMLFLASDEAKFITGSIYTMDGGMTAIR